MYFHLSDTYIMMWPAITLVMIWLNFVIYRTESKTGNGNVRYIKTVKRYTNMTKENRVWLNYV